MTTTLSSKGQVVIPMEIREMNCLKPGDRLSVEQTEGGILLRKRRKTKARLVREGDRIVLHAPKGTPRITNKMVKELEAELR